MSDQVERKASVDSEGRAAGWGLGAALVLLALVLIIATARRQPPQPRGEDAPAAEFSAARARAALAALLGDGRPHPVGSPENAAVRGRIVARLQSLGYAPTVEGGLVCRSLNCAQVANVVARLDGTQPTGDVLLLAHYDSVPAGPGAGDDMTGVAAILEAARALKAGPPPKNNVVFLLDDGEEAGLLGAQWFSDHSPAMAQVRAVVNLEARGTSGPSLMFETSADNGWTVSRYAARAPHPVTSSVFATIYDLMPNDTDLTVFKRRQAPIPGLNFAFIGEPTHYHTPLDRLDIVSAASLQHHGDNALAAVRGLADADLANPPRGNVIFFDVLGAGVLRWPIGWSLWLALLALVLVLVVAGLAVRRRTATVGGVVLGFLSFLAALVLALLGSVGLSTVARGAFPTPWVAHPLPVLATFWAVALFAVGLIAALLGRRSGTLGLWAGVWLGWSVLGLLLLTALPAPGASYLFVVPALVASLAGLASFGPRGAAGPAGTLAVLLPALVAGLLWFPIVLPLYEGLGSGALVPIAALLAILFSALAPLFLGAPAWMQRTVTVGAAAVAILGLGITVATPAYSESSPQPQSIVLHLDGDSGKARWIVQTPEPFPAGYRQAAPFPQQREPGLPWWPPQARVHAAPAPTPGLAAPELTVLSDAAEGGRRHLRLRLVSPRGARQASVLIPAAAHVESMQVDGVSRPAGGERAMRSFPGWSEETMLTLPPQGSELDVVLGAAEPMDWYVYDQSSGLPPAGAALLKARSASAAPRQDGDLTIVSRKVHI